MKERIRWTPEEINIVVDTMFDYLTSGYDGSTTGLLNQSQLKLPKNRRRHLNTTPQYILDALGRVQLRAELAAKQPQDEAGQNMAAVDPRSAADRMFDHLVDMVADRVVQRLTFVLSHRK